MLRTGGRYWQMTTKPYGKFSPWYWPGPGQYALPQPTCGAGSDASQIGVHVATVVPPAGACLEFCKDGCSVMPFGATSSEYLGGVCPHDLGEVP